MRLARRAVIAGSGSAVALTHWPARAQERASTSPIRIGVLTDISGNYRGTVGSTGVAACVRPCRSSFLAKICAFQL